MRGRVPRSRVSHERWLISYADFITLLFSFFVVLYAFARADQKQQAQIPASIDSAFKALGIFPNAARNSSNAQSSGSEKPAMPMNIVMGEDVLSPAQVKNDLNRIQRDLTQRLSNQVAQHTFAIKMGRDGLVISLHEAGFFDSGSATLHPEAIPTLLQIGRALGSTPYELRIEGHTDNIPIHTAQFDSNWELSTARAIGIARLLLGSHLIPPDRLSTAGYAEFHPIDTNTTPQGRANNRRVDLVVMPRTRINLSAPDSASASVSWRKITDGD